MLVRKPPSDEVTFNLLKSPTSPGYPRDPLAKNLRNRFLNEEDRDHHVRIHFDPRVWLPGAGHTGNHAPAGAGRTALRPKPAATRPVARQDGDRIQARSEGPGRRLRTRSGRGPRRHSDGRPGAGPAAAAGHA